MSEDRINKHEEQISELRESSARREEQMKTLLEKIDRLYKKQDEMIETIKKTNKEQNVRIKGLEDFKSKVVFASKCVGWTVGVVVGAVTFAATVLPKLGIVLID